MLAIAAASGGSGGRGGGLLALRDGAWLLGNNRVLFETAPDGSPRGLRVIGADADTVSYAFAAASQWTPSPEQLNAFAGRYRSEEVGTTWTVRVEGTRLVASPRNSLRTELTPVYPDAFRSAGGLGVVWFTRDRTGAVTEMHSGAARVWDFVFKREQ